MQSTLEMSPQIAEGIGALAADLMQVLFDARAQYPELGFPHLLSAAAVAMRGLGAVARRQDQSLSAPAVNDELLRQFLIVLAMPDELIRIVADGKQDKAGFIPVRRH
jgi:hypothetical protein